MTIQEAILAKVEESFLIAEKYFGRDFSRPQVYIWITDKTRGGHCHYGRKELAFNTVLAMENEDDFITQIVPHEVAHWIDKEVYGYQYGPVRNGKRKRIIHGKTWKSIMSRVYRLSPDRCHSYDVSSVKKRTRIVATGFIYGCSCGKTFNLTSVRHNKIVKGKKFLCNSCRGVIKLITQKTPRELEIEKLTRQLELLKKKQGS